MVKDKIKILLRGSYNFYNFGDDLILIAIIYFLENHLSLNNKNCQVFIEKRCNSFKKLNYKSPFIFKNWTDTIELFESINLKMKSKNIPRIFRITYLFIYLILLLINILLFRLSKKALFFKKIISSFKEIDVIHYIGGGYITDRWIKAMICEYFIVSIARMINPDIKVIGTGLGIGPFRYNLSLKLIKSFFNKFEFLFLREEVSLNLIRKLKIKVKSKCLGDDTILLHRILTNSKNNNNEINRKLIAVNFKDFPDHNYDTIKEDMGKILYFLYKQDFKLGYFCFGKKPGPDDINILTNLNFKIINKLVIHDPYKEGFYNFIYNLSKARFGLGFAFHFNIILKLFNINTVAIYSGAYYKQKIEGVMRFLEKTSLVLNIDNFNESNIKKLIKHLNKFKEKDYCQPIENMHINMIKEYSFFYKQIILNKYNIK